jgi:hypothetical protein
VINYVFIIIFVSVHSSVSLVSDWASADLSLAAAKDFLSSLCV